MSEKMIERCRAIALAAHAGQMYSAHPYSYHLEAVVACVREFWPDNEDVIAAAWLHDVLEDVPLSATDLIGEGVPVYVVALVDAVTDRPGKNRKERHERTYPLTVRIPDAVKVKLADRIANVRESAKSNPCKMAMYSKEHGEFVRLLGGFTRHSDWPAWDCLCELFEDE